MHACNFKYRPSDDGLNVSVIALASQYLAVYDGRGIIHDAVDGICNACHKFIAMYKLGYYSTGL